MSRKVRAGIVGMGIGKVNGRAIDANGRAEIVAICDIVPEKMDVFEEEIGRPVKKYVDYRKMCRDAEVDAVFVGTPNQVHVPVAMEAVRRDKHVLCTKPLADALRPAERLIPAAEKSGVVNMMSLSTRFSPNCDYLTRQIGKGLFGDLYYARARSIRRSGIPDWNLEFIQKGGGAFRDMGVHALDAAWWLLGLPRPISATGVGGAKFGPKGLGFWEYRAVPRKHYRQYAADDYAGGFIRFEGGVGLQIESFWASHQPEEFQVELFGTKAGGSLEPIRIHRTVDGAPQDIDVKLPTGPSAWDRIAAHFIDCILDGTECLAPLRHGLIVQRMMEAVLKSAKIGREVRLT
jgi:predicted dehydrogenase